MYAKLTPEQRENILSSYEKIRGEYPDADPTQVANAIASECLGLSSKALHRNAGKDAFAAVLTFLAFSRKLKVSHACKAPEKATDK